MLTSKLLLLITQIAEPNVATPATSSEHFFRDLQTVRNTKRHVSIVYILHSGNLSVSDRTLSKERREALRAHRACIHRV